MKEVCYGKVSRKSFRWALNPMVDVIIKEGNFGYKHTEYTYWEEGRMKTETDIRVIL